MDSSSLRSRKSKKMRDIVRLRQILKKWKKVANNNVPKGFVAVCVGKELKRFVIPTEYLSHQAFGILLRQAEEEFGFQQEGVLKFPCDVDLFQKILKMMGNKKHHDEFEFFDHDCNRGQMFTTTCGKDFPPNHGDLTPSSPQYPQMCR